MIFKDVLKDIISLKTEAKMCVMYAQKVIRIFEQPSDNNLQLHKFIHSSHRVA